MPSICDSDALSSARRPTRSTTLDPIVSPYTYRKVTTHEDTEHAEDAPEKHLSHSPSSLLRTADTN